MRWCKSRQDYYKWHRWFAWYHVQVISKHEGDQIVTCWVWRDYVERRLVNGWCESWWEYRDMKEESNLMGKVTDRTRLLRG